MEIFIYDIFIYDVRIADLTSNKAYCATLYILRRQVQRALSSLVQNKQFIRSNASLFGIVTDNY